MTTRKIKPGRRSTRLTARKWPTAGGGEVDVLQWGIDTGAFTQALYDRVGGRHALLATKGDNRPSAAPLKKGRADLRDHRGRADRGPSPQFGVHRQFRSQAQRV